MNKTPKNHLKWLLIVLAIVLIGGVLDYFFFIKKATTTIPSSSSPTALTSISPSASASASNHNSSTTPSANQSVGNSPSPTIPANAKKFEGEIGGINCDTVQVTLYYPDNLKLYQGNVFNQNPKAPAWLEQPNGSSSGPKVLDMQSDYYPNCKITGDSEINNLIEKIKNPPASSGVKEYTLIEQPVKTTINGNTAITWQLKVVSTMSGTPSHPSPYDYTNITKAAIIINSKTHQFVYVSSNEPANTDWSKAFNVVINSLTFK